MSEDVKELLRAKIPCEETGIEIRHSVCDICTPGPQCGLDVYVKDGKVIELGFVFKGENEKAVRPVIAHAVEKLEM